VLAATGPLMVFAELLKRTTHHRPLGAATFAIVGAGVLCAAVAMAARLVALWRKPGRAQRWWRAAGIAVVGGSALLVAALVLPALRDAALRSGLLDTLLAVALLVLAVRLRDPAGLGRRVRLLAPVSWIIVVGAGAITLHAVPAVHASVQSAGPVLLEVLTWLAG
jgi:hypothetical protein